MACWTGAGRLYFAAADTVKIQLGSTGIASAWLLDQLDDCRARRQVLVLDCCFSGSFAHGSKGDTDLDLERRLAGQGRGRAVLTASRAGEYSFEGQALPGARWPGQCSPRAWSRVCGPVMPMSAATGTSAWTRRTTTPTAMSSPAALARPLSIWLYGGEGTIVLARSPAGVAITPAPAAGSASGQPEQPLPGSPHRRGPHPVRMARRYDPARALTAEQKLRQIGDTDMPAVAAAARDCLPSPKPTDTTRRSGQEIPAAKRAKRQLGPRRTAAMSGPQTSATPLVPSAGSARAIEFDRIECSSGKCTENRGRAQSN